MNLLKEKLNPNSEYNKKLRRDGIVRVKEMYKEAIECLESYIKKYPCNSNYKIKLGIEALEKQIPKKTIYNHHCPVCDRALPIKRITNEYCHCCFEWKYCPDCGQRIDWGNENGKNNKS